MNSNSPKNTIWKITDLSGYLPEQFITSVEPIGSAALTPSPERIKQLAQEKRSRALNESEVKPMKKASIHIILVAALVGLLSVSAFAAFGGLDYFKTIFGDSAQAIEQQIAVPQITAAANGREMALEAMVTDGYVTNLVVSLTGAEPTAEHLFSFDYKEASSLGWFRMEEFSDRNKSYFMVTLAGKQRFEQKQLTLSLNSEVAPISLTFQPENHLGNAVVAFPEGAMSGETTLRELQISPMGFLLVGKESNAKGGLPGTSILLEYTDGKTELLEVEFDQGDATVSGGGGAIMSDDPAQLPLVSNFSGTRNPDGALVINGRFSRIIDPAAIGKVSVNGVSYPVSGSTSASK